MRMTNGARRKAASAIGTSAIAQGRVPILDIERTQLLRRLSSEVWRNLFSANSR
jgi:hypothetical protein